MDRMDQMDAYRALSHENISYGDLLREHLYDADLIDGYVELMVEVCCAQLETIRINQEDLPAAVVGSRLLKLDREHILYAMESMQRNTTQVANIRAYTLSALYNVPVTMELSVQQVKKEFEIEYGSSIDDFLESVFSGLVFCNF